MGSNRRLLQLSSLIQDNTAKVDAYIKGNGLPEPSFEASCPPLLNLSPEADAARQAALEALDELRDHLLSPLGMITSAVTDIADLVSLSGLARFNMAANLPAESTITVPELAKTCGMHPEDADAIVKHGVTRRLFLQDKDGKIRHSAASKTIANQPHVASAIEGIVINMWKSAPFAVEMMEKWPGSQEINQTAYNLARNTDLSFFEHLAQDEVNAGKFAHSMSFLLNGPALVVDFVLDYDWSQHANGTVVDVGGSHGDIAFKLADTFPNMKLIVEDRPEVIALAPHTANKNVHFQAHDFFIPQPVKGADVYFLRWILHDWPTKYCIKILQALMPALKRGARIVLMESILPETGVLSPYQERAVRNFDIVMKLLFNARERSESEWRTLVGDADDEGRFKVMDVRTPVGSHLGFVVIEWVG